MKPRTLVLVTALGAAGFAASCVQTRTNLDPTHCNSNDGDAFCAREHPEGDLPFCRLGNMACDEAAGITDLGAGDPRKWVEKAA